MKRTVLSVLGVAALLASMIGVSAMATDRQYIDAKLSTENGQQVKIFNLANLSDGRCQFNDSAVLKYFQDGGVVLDGKIQCQPHHGKYENGLSLETDFLPTGRNHQLFDKQYSRAHITRSEWVEWKMQELGNDTAARNWDQVTRIRVDLDHQT